jgi:hypothetical protein
VTNPPIRNTDAQTFVLAGREVTIHWEQSSIAIAAIGFELSNSNDSNTLRQVASATA